MKNKIIKKLKVLKYDGRELVYTVKTNPRARVMRLAIYPDCRVVITKPCFVSEFFADKMIKEKIDWLWKKLDNFKKRGVVTREENRRQYLELKKQALILVWERLEYYNRHYNFEFNKISIRNQSSRWGSCSSKKNLNFNYKIVLLPIDLANYVIVHELCHLKEMNHSPRFWRLVRETIPSFLSLRKQLKRQRINFY